LRKSIAVESQLVELTQAAESASTPTSPAGDAPDPEDAAREQRLVAGWVETLPEKARQQAAAAASATPSDTSAAPPNSTSATAPPDARPHARPPMVDILAKTQELAPKAQAAAGEAASHLDKKVWRLALPKQEEALKLLKELAESVPPPPQDQPQDEKDKEEKPDEGDKKEPSSNSAHPDPAQQEKPQDSKSPDASPDQKSTAQRKISRQQMEALLRQARERERDYKEQKKQMERVLRGGIKVDKDW
jgi:hypothetical protein